MTYIGPGVDNGYRSRFIYTATAGQTSFSGGDANGITLTYTDSEYLDVYQNGVLLVPGDDYAATTGTTVVLVQGASLNDKVEMIQYQAFGVADTVSRADGGAFGGNISTSGTLTVTGGIVSPVTINGTTPTLTIGDAGAEDAKIVFDGNAQDFHIGLDDSADSLTIGLGSTLGTTSHMVIDGDGHVSMPKQSCFMADVGSQQANIAEGANVDVQFSNERFDLNSDYNNSNYTFTAPVTGKYQANVVIRFSYLSQGAAYYYVELNTSNDNYYNIFDPDFGQDTTFWTVTFSSLIDMDAGDTAKVRVQQEASGTGGQTDIEDTSFFSIYLVA